MIESDDWGSIRMPSKEVYNILQQNNIDLTTGDSYRYNKYDTLASPDDLEAIFNVLAGYKDMHGENPIVTAVTVVANPDFSKIKQSDFMEYHYEPFTTTLENNPGREDSMVKWSEGINNRLFKPEFHGREHINVNLWLNDLKSGDKDAHLAFDLGMWGFNNKNRYGISYQAAFDFESASELVAQKLIIEEGCNLFQDIFKYRARFFVPPNSALNNSLEHKTHQAGIDYIANAKLQYEPKGQGKRGRKLHFLGQKNKHGQRYILRNCFFEPSAVGTDWVSSCLEDIGFAFRYKKPAIISTHRVNYIGGLDVRNRVNGISMLDKLLKKALAKWPGIEFLTSTELGDLMVKSSQNNKAI